MSGKSRGRPIRRFIRKLFATVMKRQSCECTGDRKQFLKRFKEVEESIETVAREMARQARKDEVKISD